MNDNTIINVNIDNDNNVNNELKEFKGNKVHISRGGKIYYVSQAGNLCKIYKCKDKSEKRTRTKKLSDDERNAHYLLSSIKSMIKRFNISLLTNAERTELLSCLIDFEYKINQCNKATN